MDKFIEKWYKISKTKKTNICAGLDPAIFEMWRWEKGLAKWVNKLDWSLNYIRAVAPFCAAIKPNIWYFWDIKDREILKEIVKEIHKLWLLAIADWKISDIGSTSDAYIFDYKKLWFDALTIAPYAWNIEELISFWKKRDIAVISMWLMSNKEYKTEMNFTDKLWISLWQSRVERALKSWVSWLVVGWTFTKNDKDFKKFISLTNDKDVLYLIPWIWFQWWEIKEFLESSIKKEKCIINSWRALMFPNWSNSTCEEQALRAKKLRDEFNFNF